MRPRKTLVSSTIALSMLCGTAGQSVFGEEKKDNSAALAAIYAGWLTSFDLGKQAKNAGKWAKAESHLRDAIDLREDKLQKKDAELADAYSLLAEVYQKQNKLEDSQRCYRKALAITAKTTGPGTELVARYNLKLGQILSDQKMYMEAATFFGDALKIFEHKFGSTGAETTAARAQMAKAYLGGGMYDKAEPIVADAIAACEKAEDTSSPGFLALLESQSEILHKMDKTADAEAIDARIRVLKQLVATDPTKPQAPTKPAAPPQAETKPAVKPKAK